ncbi:MAG TPA: copper chaperone PCu(A)C [Mycobacteriales bacterium]|nr:copper chaperone PCu(A)C [Mycobacteriales bacterium]
MSLRSAPARPFSGRVSRGAPAVGLAATLLLAGCGAGQRAEVYQERTVADATNDAVGAIAVRNLAVEAPEEGRVLQQGTDASLVVTLVNKGAEDDILVSATTPAAQSVRVTGPSAGVPVPRLGTSSGEYSLELVGLTRDLPTGTYIDLTLNFQRNGTKTMLVPVQTTPEGAPRPTEGYEVAETDSEGEPLVHEEE